MDPRLQPLAHVIVELVVREMKRLDAIEARSAELAELQPTEQPTVAGQVVNLT